jgi:hypothetical protein
MAGLPKVLTDPTTTYLYGNGRIAQYSGANTNYFLSDALGSERQLTWTEVRRMPILAYAT